MPHVTLYSYLMGVQAIDQNIFPEVLGKTKPKVVYCPRSIEQVGLSQFGLNFPTTLVQAIVYTYLLAMRTIAIVLSPERPTIS